ncbi:zinc finger CCCH domain-containing protein 48-like [Cornus florida]|uniref:zinc finger CCCH domain-containing protein 48-like n=1 Tax=Cornus florida TaxID=4283 RepID=UPI0028A025CD|nr:zinc finger CCCH domain-containing protein 48-like [Cornus florida]XP_059651484.1 zinc finger CCCH domain-containing protein 48-like [Cornus florida]
MAIKATRRVSDTNERSSVFNRRGGGGGPVVNKVCSYWLAGRCTRKPCRFLHSEESLPQKSKQQCHRGSPYNKYPGSNTWQRSPNYGPKKSSAPPSGGAGSGAKSPKKSSYPPSGGAGSGAKIIEKTPEKAICQYWIVGNCVHGDQCGDLHSWFSGNGFSVITKLVGHTKDVTGIALPSCSNKLYSGSRDKSVRGWDCVTGQSVGVLNLEGEIYSMISEGPWVFAGLQNAVKAWNTQSHTDLTLDGPVGAVHAMAVGNDVLFAGTQDGTILAWKSGSVELAAALKGHSGAVVSLVVGANRLYSGSMDHTIRAWDLDTLKCIHTLNGHTDTVMSVICWDIFLLSCSLDRTIKAWATTTDDGNLEVIHTRNMGHGVLTICGIQDAEKKPILLCSLDDNTVCLLELPSFKERGKIFAKGKVGAIQRGPEGLFFTGDAIGELSVWKLSEESSMVAAS